MAINTIPQLKHAEFWEKMERAREEAQKWPEWMKGSPVNRRESKESKSQTDKSQAPPLRTARY
ncbi:MAG: hypothetical protein JO356_02935 [Acidobacteria bacterium]|nr:hypothetical protein [Acidobacteriota bacterium]